MGTVQLGEGWRSHVVLVGVVTEGIQSSDPVAYAMFHF